jgi:hypothetical protein
LAGGCAFTDDEPTFGGYRYAVNLVKAFFQGRSLQLPKRASDCGDRNPLLSRALLVAANGVGQRGLKVIRDYAETSFPSRAYVSRPVARQGIGIVDDKRLLRRQARSQKELFAVACAQHIQIYADVRVEETLAIKGAFSGALYSDKDYGFHYLARPGFMIGQFAAYSKPRFHVEHRDWGPG